MVKSKPPRTKVRLGMEGTLSHSRTYLPLESRVAPIFSFLGTQVSKEIVSDYNRMEPYTWSNRAGGNEIKEEPVSRIAPVFWSSVELSPKSSASKSISQ